MTVSTLFGACPHVSSSLSESIRAHAIRDYPNEACGVVINGSFEGYKMRGEYVPMQNISERPRISFKMSPKEYLQYEEGVFAIVHSHPDTEPFPSGADMEHQIETGLPWVLVSTDGSNCHEPFVFGDSAPRPDLMDRPFRYGVTDCYSAIRDYLAVHAHLDLKNYPRNWGWWNKGPDQLDMYADFFGQEGFVQLPEGVDPQPFDCFLLRVRSNVFNHGGVYIGDGRVYHHISSFNDGAFSPTKRPVVEFAHRWMSLNPTFVRHASFFRG